MCHSPSPLGRDVEQEPEGADSCLGCVQRAPSSPGSGGLGSITSTLCMAGWPCWGGVLLPRDSGAGTGAPRCLERDCWGRGLAPWAAPTHVNELLLLPLCHLAEAVVPARQVPAEAIQCLHSHLLHLPPLSTGAGWRQAQPTDAAPGPDTGREHIALIKVAKLYLQQTQAMGHLEGGTGRALSPRPRERHHVWHRCPARTPWWHPGLWCASWCGDCTRCAAPESRGQTGQQTPGSEQHSVQHRRASTAQPRQELSVVLLPAPGHVAAGGPAGERGHGVSCGAMAIPTASAAQVSRAPGPGRAGCRALETAAPREPCVPQGHARAGRGLGRGGGSDLRGCGTCCRDWGNSGCCRCLERPEQDRTEAALTS